MKGGGGLRLELSYDGRGGVKTVSWNLKTPTDGPEGLFVALISDRDEWLLQAGESLEIQRQAVQKFINP
jgi:uncharacterized protein RhaS with RHS repeats